MTSALTAWSGLEVGPVLPGGRRSDVRRGRLGAASVVVRRSRRSPASLDWELDVLDRVARAGVGVAEPIPAADGRWHVDGVVVQRWVDGREPTTPDDWTAVAAALDVVHGITSVAQRPGCCVVTELGVRRRSVDADLDALPPVAAARVLAVFESFRDAPVSLIHGDPGAPNIRCDGAGTVWLLDWDESRVDVSWLDRSELGVQVLDDVTHHRAAALSHAWESANAWVVEPDYARRRLTALDALAHDGATTSGSST